MSKMYAVKMSTGDYDSEYSWIQFVTYDKEYAERYVSKFNAMLIKWNQYFNQFKTPYGWIDEKHYDTWIYDRYSLIKDYNMAFVVETELR